MRAVTKGVVTRTRARAKCPVWPRSLKMAAAEFEGQAHELGR